jgi:stage II sporulation protein Q
MKEEQKRSGWKQFFKKKWFFPAVYLGSAALILALITWYQNPADFEISQKEYSMDDTVEKESIKEPTNELVVEDQGEAAVPVNATEEEMAWPMAQDEEIQVVTGFFDDNATEEAQMAAMVEYDRSYHPHQGLDLSHSEGKAFDVQAALSGKVIKADKDPLVGNQVEIEHQNGLVTVYQSLEELKVAVGDEIKQGDVIGQAGRNVFEKALGVHVHFEVRKDGAAVNPDQFLSKGQ